MRVARDLRMPCLPFFSQRLVEAAGRRHPAHQRFGTMNVQLIGHEDPAGLGVAGHGPGDVLDEIGLGAGRLNRGRDQLAGDDVKVADEGLRAVADVLELAAFAAAGLHRLRGGHALRSEERRVGKECRL